MSGADMDARLLKAAREKKIEKKPAEMLTLNVSLAEIDIIIEGLYWKGNEVGPDSVYSRRLYHKLYKAREKFIKQRAKE
ncbi:hypothetical protein [uncultured Megasphaera sp.]|uniref:hypothetical protein n=1 Tax=uncultured Megasphaera sp. TaxID=165188 RepID=UPI00265D406A|nr:hypothetical protein [uncultured Megasphaera sp.]